MSARAIKLLVVLVLVILSLAIIGNSMTKPVGRDEHMYCTGAVLMAQGKMIYRDFSYAAQMPYHPLLCATLFKLLGTTYYLLTARLLSCACDILVMLCIVGIYRHVFKTFAVTGISLGVAAVVLYVFNPLVDYANGYGWNHDVVILCVTASFWLFISTDFERKSKYWRIAAIGALLTFATCMRVTTVLVEFLFFVILLSLPAKSMKQRLVTALPFLLAMVLVSIWPLTLVARAPRAFFLNMVRIPMLYGQWLHKIGMVFNKLTLTRLCLTTPGYFVLLAFALYLVLTVLFLRRKLKVENAHGIVLAALLPAVFFVIALIPPTMWRQYFAVPVPFLVIALALPLSYLRKLPDKTGVSIHFKISAALMGFCGLVAVLSYLVVLRGVPLALVPESWVPLHVHRLSQDIASKTKEPRLVLTLAPLLALEGGCEIYPQLSCGSVIYRAADALSPEDRATTNIIGRETLAELIEENPPSAVILGIEQGKLAILEAPLRTAVGADWEKKDYEFGPSVYFRP